MTPKYKTGYIYLISFISALGGYLFGFDFAVIAGALPFLKAEFDLNAYQEGFTTASLALGCMAGCMYAGRSSESLGRRISLTIAALVFTVSSILMAVATSITFFICARFCAGFAVGMASLLSPMYIAEISPANLRGRMVSLNQLAVVIGILVTNIVNYYLSAGGQSSWRWMFGAGAIPSCCFLAGILLLPESPSWLYRKGREDAARNILQKIGDTVYVQQAMNSIGQSSRSTERVSFKKLFQLPYSKPVLAGVVLAVFQQFCGINVVFNYTPSIFESIGFDKDDQLMQTVFIGAINLTFTLVAITLVDRVGRKPLMLTGAVLLSVLHLVLALALASRSPYTTIPLLASIAVYASTLAPVTWVLISEIFPGKVRSAATSFSVLCLWGAYFILTFTFPILSELLGGIANTFYLYAAICAGGALFIWRKIKETRGVELEDMDSVFRH
ncbi:MAG: MFS transporter [Chitinophagaceae bacterium]|nr:MAG: MFS transporter [Chitinophagaceae bacterium]